MHISPITFDTGCTLFFVQSWETDRGFSEKDMEREIKNL